MYNIYIHTYTHTHTHTHIYIYIHKSFSTILDKDFRKNIKKKERDREIGKHKLNQMGAQNMK